MEQKNPDRQAVSFTENPVSWHDITAALIWPLMLRVPAMALRPSRIILGTLGAFLLASWSLALTADPDWLGQSFTSSFDSIQSTISLTLTSAVALSPAGFIAGFTQTLTAVLNLLMLHPIKSLTIVAPALLILGVTIGAGARSCSTEYATGRHTDAADALIQSCRNVRQYALATLGPLVIVAILAALILLNGFILGIPVLDLLGGLLYAVSLIVGVFTVLLISIHLLALPLTVASMAIENTDGFDAAQRAWAYLLNRPLRYFLYLGITLACGSVIIGIMLVLKDQSVRLTDALSSTLTNDTGRRILGEGDDIGATAPAARSVINFWRTALDLIVSGYVLSYASCASAMLYLALRRVCDGQDTTEIWDEQSMP